MRKATFAIPGTNGTDAELTITAFPGDVGGELANLNRWRSQLELPPLPPTELDQAIDRHEHEGLKIALVDFANSKGDASTRILGAWIPFEGGTWFFKMTGPDAVVAREKQIFDDFLHTVKPSGAQP